MKKILIIAVSAMFLFSCKKNNDAATDVHTRQEHLAPNNKMAALMDGMMLKMHTKSTGNNDADYARMMVEHHKGAVEMAKLQLNEGKNTELKAFSEKVMAEQGREIDLMLKHTGKTVQSPNSAEFEKALNASMSAMMGNGTENYNDIDKDFAAQMIPHHQSAVEMAQAYLKFGNDPELMKLSTDIVENQTQEITLLKDWLQSNKYIKKIFENEDLFCD